MIQGHGGVLDRFDSYLLGGVGFYATLHLLGIFNSSDALDFARATRGAADDTVDAKASRNLRIDGIDRHASARRDRRATPTSSRSSGWLRGATSSCSANRRVRFGVERHEHGRRRTRRACVASQWRAIRTIVLAATDGSVAFEAVFAAVERGIDVAVANKELVVAAGALLVEAAQS